MEMRQIVIIAHDIRSTFNVGSILRTADGIGIERVYLTGYTPYPIIDKDERLPHIARKLTAQIAKTALGAENTVSWQHVDSLDNLLVKLKNEGYELAALEQSAKSIPLNKYQPPEKIALLLGNEVEGVTSSYLKSIDTVLEIPMNGQKESFNVSIAAAIAMYHLKYQLT